MSRVLQLTVTWAPTTSGLLVRITRWDFESSPYPRPLTTLHLGREDVPAGAPPLTILRLAAEAAEAGSQRPARLT